VAALYQHQPISGSAGFRVLDRGQPAGSRRFGANRLNLLQAVAAFSVLPAECDQDVSLADVPHA
jgi:hypothetical protein